MNSSSGVMKFQHPRETLLDIHHPAKCQWQTEWYIYIRICEGHRLHTGFFTIEKRIKQTFLYMCFMKIYICRKWIKMGGDKDPLKFSKNYKERNSTISIKFCFLEQRSETKRRRIFTSARTEMGVRCCSSSFRRLGRFSSSN